MWFNGKPKVAYRVIEIEKPRQIPPADREAVESIMSLQSHPGFQNLIARLKLQRNRLESILRNRRHDDIRGVEFIQSGIFWTNWLERQVEQTVLRHQAVPQEAAQTEDALFRQLDATLERVE